MMRSSGYNRFGVLMGTSWPASGPRSHRLQGRLFAHDNPHSLTACLLCYCGVNAVGSEELEEAPDANASAKLAFGELHGRLVMDAPQEHGVEVHGQVHGHAYARRVGKVLQVHMPRAIALGSRVEFLEFML